MGVTTHGRFTGLKRNTPEWLAAMKKQYAEDPEHRNKILNNYFKRTYGLTIDEVDSLSEKQGHLCAICGKPETRKTKGGVSRLAVDHDHETGAVRGLLCYACNTGIGKLGDDPGVLWKAFEYLVKNKMQ